MKQLSIILNLAFILFAGPSFAQTSKLSYKIINPDAVVNPESKAVKNFKRTHPDVTNESWSTDNGYYFVKFKKGDVKNKIVYTPNGKVDYTLKMYNGENNLPRAVKATVKSIYYDYKILDAQELMVKNNTIYLVKITDSKTWKTIRVSDGDVEEIEDYSNVISPCR